jgi:hypothetical protein
VNESAADRLVEDFPTLGGQPCDGGHVDEIGRVPPRIVEPTVQPIEERFEWPSAASWWARPGIDAIDLAEEANHSGQVGSQRCERTVGQVVSGGPRVRSIDPFEDRPGVGERLMGLTDVSSHDLLVPCEGPFVRGSSGRFLEVPGLRGQVRTSQTVTAGKRS